MMKTTKPARTHGTLLSVLLLGLTLLSSQAWAWPVGGGGALDDQANDIAVAASGNSYIVGSFQGLAGMGTHSMNAQGLRDVFVAKLGPSGTVIWAKSAGGISDEEGLSIAVDSAENVYITGYFYDRAKFGGTTLDSDGGTDIFIAKLDYEGNWQWARRAGGSQGDDFGREIQVTDGNNSTVPPTPGSVFVAGEYHCDADFTGGDGGPLSLNSQHCFKNERDLFLVRLENDGTWVWAHDRDTMDAPPNGTPAGASAFENVAAMALNPDTGDLYLTGQYAIGGTDELLNDSFDGGSWPAGSWPSGWSAAGYAASTYWNHWSQRYSGFTRGGETWVTSPEMNTLGAGGVRVGFRLQRGKDYTASWHTYTYYSDHSTSCSTHYSYFIGIPYADGYDCYRVYSEDPESSNEGMRVEYLSTSGWKTIPGASFPGPGTPAEVFDFTGDKRIELPADAARSGFRIRFHQMGGDGALYDYWHINDVYVEKTGTQANFISLITNTETAPAPEFDKFLQLPDDQLPNDITVNNTSTGTSVVLVGTSFGDGIFGYCSLAGSTDYPGAYVAVLNDQSLLCQNGHAYGTQGGEGLGVTTDEEGNIYFTGAFQGTMGNISVGTIDSSSANSDIFVAKLVRNGNYSWTWGGGWLTGGGDYDPSGVPGRAGSLEEDRAFGIASDGVANLYVTGFVRDLAFFGEDESVLATGGNDMFVANLGEDGRWFEIESWTIGQPVPAPPGALTNDPVLQPDIYIDGVEIPPGLEYNDLFHWSPPVTALGVEARLTPLQPLPGVEIRWHVDPDPAAEARVVSLGATRWPAYPCNEATDQGCYQIHVARAPVEVEPGDDSHTLLQTKVPAAGGSDANVTSGQFTASLPGFAVLIYAAGPTPDTLNFETVFEVVRTVNYEAAPDYSSGVPWEIGQEIVEPSHNEAGRTGYVLNELSFYDGHGLDAAYDREGRIGQIIPVNRFVPSRPQDAGKELVVAWYRKMVKGVYWPVKPIQYDPFWPLDPEQIIIASEQGGEVLGQEELDPLVYQSYSIYNQTDPAAPGFNPNDEHALLAPSTTGTGFNAIFALRSDFGSNLSGDVNAASDPYVLIKYFDPVNANWAFRVFRVRATGAGFNDFRFSGTAGTTVSPPYPLRLLASCVETTVVGQAASDPQPPPPFFQDYKGQLWAKSASRPQDSGDVLYHYPVQTGTSYDVNNDGVEDAAEGVCIPWLARLPASEGGTASPQDPIRVHYDIVWPAEVPQLVVGETLLKPKKGLPDIFNQAAVEVVFDELQDGLTEPDPSKTLAQLIDPLNPRSVRLEAVPSSIATELGTDGKERILGTADGTVKLPVSIGNLLSFDPLNKKLALKGIFDESSAGEPLLLLNVISKLNRVLLKKLDGGDGSEEANYANSCPPVDANGDPTGDDCTWDQAVEALYRLSRNPQGIEKVCTQSSINEDNERVCDLDRDVGPDDVLIGLQDTNNDGVLEPFQAVGVNAALTAGSAQDTGYLTLAFNNDAALTPLPVSLNIIRVDFLQSPPPPTPPAEADICSTYQGQIQIISPENIFDEQLVLRHSGDFGGNGDDLEYEWFFHPDLDGTPPQPLPDPEGGQLNGWLKFPTGDPTGKLEISIEGANIQTLSDNWFIARYRGLPSCVNRDDPNATDWSLWAGQPGATPLNQRAQLAEGWVKRVLKRLNPFEARVQNFAQAATNNFASMLIQLGERYEGDVALNNDPDNLNSMGLIEAYETVMRRAINLSISSTPPVNYGPANNAILLIGSRLADFYALLGNEAYADAQDPMVGITRGSVIFGFESLAPTIFNFQNQLSSVLEEELVLLRGRDDAQGPVAANPVYNRLFWNFTTGDGEVAYQNSYDITDQNIDGIIDEFDARIMFPQGHGDAWGHYLTGLDYYYNLLKHPFFTWDPRPEAITVAGTPIQVDFLDERQFAELAAAKARTGSEIVDLTYRFSYVDDPAGQWQGYKDTDEERAWGLAEWGTRAGQGAYFDWLTANAILEAEDPNPDHVGIQKVDRTTVDHLDEIAVHFEDIQAQVDEADKGLNPLGLAKGVVPFDIDPSQIDEGMTHFEQVFERAMTAIENTLMVWDFANTLTRMMRQNQQDLADMRRDSTATEVDFKNQLIEIFGYPYDDDIGVGGLYPAGYDGPDLYHYMMVDAPVLAGTAMDISGSDPLLPGQLKQFSSSYTPTANGMNYFTIIGEDEDLNCDVAWATDGCSLGEPQTGNLTVQNYTLETDLTGFTFTKDPSWTGQRRAPGEIQNIIAEMLQARIAMQRSAREYDNLRRDITDQIDTIEATHDIRNEQIDINFDKRGELMAITVLTEIMGAASKIAKQVGKAIDGGFKTAKECVPKSIIVGVAGGGDTLSAVRCSVEGGGVAAEAVADAIADVIDTAASAANAHKEDIGEQAGIEAQIQDARLELFNLKGDLDKMLRQEPLLRAEIYSRAESLKQLQGSYYAALAKGQRVLQSLITFRKQGAVAVQDFRYEDMAFRIFRNDALQKYRSAFNVSARFAYLAATAYDYETNLLGTDAQSGQSFLTQIVRERSLGQMLDSEPVPGSPGLADPLGRMKLNFEILKGQMGFNNPQTETNRFSLRREYFRIFDEPESDTNWRAVLEENRVNNLWDIPEFRRFARPFAPESAGPQPGLVIRFPSTVTFGLNFFGWDLGPGDSAYDSSHFATKVRGVGIWLEDYENLPLSNTPRAYLIPVGPDVLRAPSPDSFATREWNVVDQVIPIPFPVGSLDLEDVNWLPSTDTLIGSATDVRRYASFRAHHFSEPFDDAEIITDSRLIGRSVWNREWMLVIPGGTLLNDPENALDTLIHGQLIPGGNGERDGNGVRDIKLFFQTYSYSGI